MVKRISIIGIFYFSLLVAGFTNDETGWTYHQSILQSFYIFESVQIDNVEAEAGDVIGAFNNDICVGWVYVDEDGYTTIPLMGDDLSTPDLSGYLTNNEIPDLYIYDATYETILPLDISEISVDLDGDEVPDLVGELPGWANFGIFVLNGVAGAENPFGCTDLSACNYDPEALEDDGSCAYEVDCEGVCGGTAELSLCGVCGSAGDFCNPESGFEYQQSTFQAFYMLESTQIDDINAESGDVIGAFKDGVCVGWVNVDEAGYTTIPLMGDDGNDYTEGYLTDGEIPDLYIYDATYQIILPLDISNTNIDTDNDGNPDLEGELAGWSNNAIFILSGVSSANNTFGCTEESACNYNLDATADDGSCWSPNDGCECSDGEGSEVDCAGICNGILELDDCGVCDGGNADQDCTGLCFGDSFEDDCGVCDNDSSNDDATCTGCTDECADNYDSVNIFDDGSCAYTFPEIEDLQSDPGVNKITLSWNNSNPDFCGPDFNYGIYDLDDNFIKITSNTTTQITDLTPGVEYCFYVVIESGDNLYNPSDQTCNIPEEETGWSIDISLTIEDQLGQYITDPASYLGMSPDAEDGLDGLDIPEPPPSPPTEWASFYFPHPEWFADLGTNFTEDIRELRDLSNQLSIWNAEFLSDVSGVGSLEFDFINNAGDWPVYLKLQTTDADSVFQYYNLSSGNAIDFLYMPPNQIRSAQIIIGNSYPGPPTNFEAIGGPRRMELSWENRPLCIFDEEICNDANNRYPETGYKIFKNGQLKYLVTLMNNEVSVALEQIFVTGDESLIDVLQPPENGEFYIDFYESFDENGTLIDCGFDGLCEFDEGYIDADYGEDDGIQNRYFQYIPYLNYTGEDELIINSPDGEDYHIIITVSDEMIYEYTDEYLLGGHFYSYYMMAYNHAGDSEQSLGTSAVTLPNILPIADAGDNQLFYLYGVDQESIDVTLPYNEAEGFTDTNQNGIWDEGEAFIDENDNDQWDDENNDNQSYDPDAFEEETLIYSWEEQSSNGAWDVVSSSSHYNDSLDIGLHHFRHRVLDISEFLLNEDDPTWGAYDSLYIDIKGLPQPAQIDSLYILSNLYYLELNWEDSEYTEDNWPDGGYDDTPFLANTYEIYYEGEDSAIVTLCQADIVCNTLTDETQCIEEPYCAWSSESECNDYDGICDQTSYIHNNLAPMSEYCYEIYGVNVQSVQSLAQTNCGTTGNPPNIDLLNPIGGEILEAGSTYEIDFNISNSEYVQDISLFYSDNSAEDNWQLIYSSNDLSSSAFIQVPEATGITIDNLFKVVLNDKGDFNGNNSNQYVDQSDYRFIISSSSLDYQINSGISLVGSPLVLDSPLFQDNFCPNYYQPPGNLLCFSFDQYGDPLVGSDISIGEGYYIINVYEPLSTTLDGEILSDYSIPLNPGWNLISNPIVADVRIDSLKINEYSWIDASENEHLVSPLIFKYNNSESIHTIENQIEPFSGYWIHATEAVDLIVEPHIYDEEIVDIDPLSQYNWTMKLTASEKSPSNPIFSISDFVIIGQDDNANESFMYGEDIYDIPAIINTPYTNLYINHSQDWFASNVIDENGIAIESPRFMTDIRASYSSGDFKEWKINGELLGPINLSDSLRIEWEMENELDGNYSFNLLINGITVDMRENSYVDIAGEDFNEFLIQMGDIDLDNDSFLISDFILKNPYPNPFNPVTQLDFNIPVSDYIEINVYDINGHIVESLYNGYIQSGQHVLEWDANQMSSGVYFFKASYQDNIIIKKSILIK